MTNEIEPTGHDHAQANPFGVVSRAWQLALERRQAVASREIDNDEAQAQYDSDVDAAFSAYHGAASALALTPSAGARDLLTKLASLEFMLSDEAIGLIPIDNGAPDPRELLASIKADFARLTGGQE